MRTKLWLRKRGHDGQTPELNDLNLDRTRTKSHKTGLWVLNAMVAGMAVFVAALAGIVFIVTKSGWAIVACIIIENGLVVMHSVFMARIVRP